VATTYFMDLRQASYGRCIATVPSMPVLRMCRALAATRAPCRLLTATGENVAYSRMSFYIVVSMEHKVMVVGGSSGIGAATAAHFRALGADVLVADICPPVDTSMGYLRCDLRDPSSIDALLAAAGNDWDTLAHVAGLPGTRPPLDVLNVNFFGMRRLVKGMLDRLNPGGSAIVVASTAGMLWQHRTDVLNELLAINSVSALEAWLDGSNPAYPVYNLSKEAAILAIKRLAPFSWKNHRVRLNIVSPGPVETTILPDFEATMGREFLASVGAAVGRHARVEDVAPVICFLASPEASWVIGQDIHVDGGFTSSISSAAP
jgi:NAD(P)-dependent dehydrogenase (short-subunit alcohol dehydrogenase family)